VKEWLQSRTPRERRILAAGAAFLSLALLYGAVLHPFFAGLAQLRRTAAEQEDLLHWMHRTAAEIRALRRAGGGAPATGGSILSVVDRTARAEHLDESIKRMDPDNRGGVRVSLEQAPFDQVARWLGRLQHDAGLQITSVSLEASGVPGQVNGRVILEGAGS